MKYEFLEKKSVPNVVVIFIFSALLLWGTIASIKSLYYKRAFSKSESRYTELAEQLDRTTERERELENICDRVGVVTDEAVKTIDRAGELLQDSISTVGGVQQKIQILEEYVHNLEFYIIACRDFYCDYIEIN